MLVRRSILAMMNFISLGISIGSEHIRQTSTHLTHGNNACKMQYFSSDEFSSFIACLF